MAFEIERKFLVDATAWGGVCESRDRIEQGYVPTHGWSVRVRIRAGRGYLSVKSDGSILGREEYEFPIPEIEAREMLARACAQPVLQKTRHLVRGPDGLIWEVDVFGGALDGLVLAEIELPAVDASFELPPWVTAEVTHDPAYRNANLAQRLALDALTSESGH